MVEGLGTSPQKIIFLSRVAKLQNLQKQCKNYPKIHGQTGGAVAPSPPEYANDRAWRDYERMVSTEHRPVKHQRHYV